MQCQMIKVIIHSLGRSDRIEHLAGFFLIAVLFLSLWPVKEAYSAQTLLITGNKGRYEMAPYLEILEDKNNEWTINVVSSAAVSKKFEPLTTRTLNLGLTSSAIWIRFTVAVRKPPNSAYIPNQKWYLDFKRFYLEHCDFYIPISDDEYKPIEGWQVINASSQRKWIKHSPVKLPLEFPILEQFAIPQTLYLRLQHSSALFLPLTIFSADEYFAHSKKANFWYGIYFGTILAMFLFNLFVYIALREHISLYYLFYIGSVATYFLFLNGFAFHYMFTDQYHLHQILHMISLGFTILFGVYFAKNFLSTKLNSKLIDKFLVSVIFGAALFIAFAPFAKIALLNQIGSILGIISPLLVIIAGLIAWKKGFRPIFFFLVAWTILSFGGFIFALTYRGILPYTTINIHSFQIGSGLEVVILSFALAHRVRILRRERQRVFDMFGKYVTREVRDEILSGRIPLDGEIKEVTLLFADLRDFTRLAESSPPREVVRIINCYFTEMANSIHLHNGLVLQFIGDEIEAVFGAPMSLDNHPRLAVQSALEMRKRLDQLNENLISQNYQPLRHGIGIHTGQVIAANIGSLDRLSYALVGDSVNVASRIQEQTKAYQTDIIISSSTQTALDREFELDRLDLIRLRGKTQTIQLFAVK